jgi:hypothetical protein
MIAGVECCRCHKFIKPERSCSIRSSRPWDTHYLPVVRTDEGPVCFDCHAEEMSKKILPHLIKRMERIKTAAEKCTPKHADHRD